MTSFPGQKGPCTTDAPTVKGQAVVTLAKTIVVVAVPAGTAWCIHLKYRIDHPNGVPDQGIMRVTNSITNQFEKAGIHDIFGRIFVTIARALIGQHQCSTIGILVNTLSNVAWVDANVMSRYSGN